MQDILDSVAAIFTAFFTPSTGYVSKAIALITGEPYLLIGLGLMLAGATLSFLRKIIRST